MPKARLEAHFPHESPAYRAARKKLLTAERKLRGQIEAVAAQRRQLPAGGRVPEDYVFERGKNAEPVRLSELFRPECDALLLYSYMYGPNMKTPCTSCTSILDGLNGAAPHILDRVPFYAVAKSPIGRILGLARSRGWTRLQFLSSAHNTYNRDYYGEGPNGDQWPSLNVFQRKRGKIYHFYHTETLFDPRKPGMDSRHVDMIWPLWNMFDYTPEGRGANWYPKLAY